MGPARLDFTVLREEMMQYKRFCADYHCVVPRNISRCDTLTHGLSQLGQYVPTELAHSMDVQEISSI